jgi:hypothetical protein
LYVLYLWPQVCTNTYIASDGSSVTASSSRDSSRSNPPTTNQIKRTKKKTTQTHSKKQMSDSVISKSISSGKLELGIWPMPLHLMHDCNSISSIPSATCSARNFISDNEDLSFEVRQLFNSDEEEEIDYSHNLYSFSTATIPEIPIISMEELCCWNKQETYR